MSKVLAGGWEEYQDDDGRVSKNFLTVIFSCLICFFINIIVKLIFPQHVSPTYLQTYYVDHKTGVRTWDKPIGNTGNEAATSQLPPF